MAADAARQGSSRSGVAGFFVRTSGSARRPQPPAETRSKGEELGLPRTAPKGGEGTGLADWGHSHLDSQHLSRGSGAEAGGGQWRAETLALSRAERGAWHQSALTGTWGGRVGRKFTGAPSFTRTLGRRALWKSEDPGGALAPPIPTRQRRRKASDSAAGRDVLKASNPKLHFGKPRKNRNGGGGRFAFTPSHSPVQSQGRLCVCVG